MVAAMGMKKILKIFCEKVCRIKKSVYLCTRLQEISTTNDGAIAQLVEQRTENPCVPGSNPGGTTEKNSYIVVEQRFRSFSFSPNPDFGNNLATFLYFVAVLQSNRYYYR